MPLPRSSSTFASDELVKTLTEFGLCELADIRRVGRHVRRLARDLPAFDSVWIDALAQSRTLTPFQARMLDEGNAVALRIGSWVMLEELGRGPRGSTLKARWRCGSSMPRELSRLFDRGIAAVKRLHVAPADLPECQQRLKELVERTSGWTHPHLVVPSLVIEPGPIGSQKEIGGLAVASRFIPGTTLSELLVRRGRYPANVVLDLVRQLLEGLASLDSRGFVHGDIRLSNVRLTDRGQAVLVDGGIRSAILPHFTIHDELSFDGYDGLAPELIGTGSSSTVSSEIYALGCLMWQLLAGRPPHLMADPLMKLSAHQSLRIENVLVWAPDTPREMAEVIYAMTSPKVEERPGSFGELLRRFGRAGAASRSRLKAYRRQFNHAVPHLSGREAAKPKTQWALIAGGLLTTAGAIALFADPGRRLELLSVSDRVVEAIRSATKRPVEADPSTKGSNPDVAQSQRQDAIKHGHPVAKATGDRTTRPRDGLGNGRRLLPSPNSAGEIILTENGPYEVADLNAEGSITIRAASGVRPVLLIADQPMRISATSVVLSQISVRRKVISNPKPFSAMLLVRSDEFRLQGCRIETDMVEASAANPEQERHNSATRSSDASSTSTGALGWIPRTELTAEASPFAPTAIAIENSMFTGEGPALQLADTPANIAVHNVLKVGGGAFITLGHKATAKPLRIELTRITLREAGPLFRVGGELASQAGSPVIEIIARDCVFAPSGSASSLIDCLAETVRDDIATSIAFDGPGSVVSHGVSMLAVRQRVQGKPTVIDEADEYFQGLIAGDLQFSAPSSANPEDARLTHLSAPRPQSQTELPGVATELLPVAVSK